MNITFVPFLYVLEYSRIRRHNASASRFRDVTDQFILFCDAVTMLG